MTICRFDIKSYLQKITEATRTGDCIDLQESQELFDIAHQCGPEASGNDAIQFLYKQITGIPNSERNAIDQRPLALGILRTFHAAGENFCVNFDPIQTERPMVCTPSLEEDKTLSRVLESLPVNWCDERLGAEPFHVTLRLGAESSANEKNWRVFLQSASTELAKDIIEKNLPYPDLIADAIKLGAEAERDPWRVNQFAYDVFDIMIRSREISEAAKMEHGNILTTYIIERIQQLPDGVYQMAFTQTYGKTFHSFRLSIRTEGELAEAWSEEYYNEGFGRVHGVANTVAISAGIAYVAPWLLKAGWALATGATVAVAPAAVVISAVAVGVVAIGYLAVEVWSWFEGEEEHEEQYERRVNRYVPPEKKPGDGLIINPPLLEVEGGDLPWPARVP